MAEHLDIIQGKRRRFRIDVIAISGDKVLASYVQSERRYEVPGGGMDEGETPEEAAVREAMEEAGWIVSWPILPEVQEPTLFKSIDDHWFHESGWDEEVQIPVLCTVISHSPKNDTYNTEGDGRIFKLIPIRELLLGCKFELSSREITPRRAMQLRIRIELLTKVFK